MPVALYRVVDGHGEIVAEYVKGLVADGASFRRAIAHAARCGGRVFFIDQHGYLKLVFGAREPVGDAA